jgi:hypothetical protein
LIQRGSLKRSMVPINMHNSYIHTWKRTTAFLSLKLRHYTRAGFQRKHGNGSTREVTSLWKSTSCSAPLHVAFGAACNAPVEVGVGVVGLEQDGLGVMLQFALHVGAANTLRKCADATDACMVTSCHREQSGGIWAFASIRNSSGASKNPDPSLRSR